MTIDATPRAFNHRLPQPVFAGAALAVSAWVALNHRALADFWTDGTGWMDDEVAAFKAALRKLPPSGAGVL